MLFTHAQILYVKYTLNAQYRRDRSVPATCAASEVTKTYTSIILYHPNLESQPNPNLSVFLRTLNGERAISMFVVNTVKPFQLQ